MSQMHGFRGWAPTSVQVKGLALFNLIQDQVQISVRKEDTPAQKMVNWKKVSWLESVTHTNVGIIFNLSTQSHTLPSTL